ncbi:Uma2 family endonuclease [Streptomyces violaceorubidus]
MRGDVVDDPEQTRYPAEAVTLAIEVVAESVSRDRETKPVKYARAGIGHYWRVENEKGLAVVHAFELEPTTGAYTSVGIFRERMKVSAPFPMDLDLTGIKPRRGGE